MRLRPGCLLPYAALLAFPLGGCHYVAAGAGVGAALGVATAPPEPPAGSAPWRPGSAITIDFAAPRALVAAVPRDRDSLRVRAATRVVGRVRRLHGDTIVMSLTMVGRIDGGSLASGIRDEPVARVLHDGNARVEVITLRPSRTTRGAIGAVVGAGVTVAGLYAWCALTQCFGN